MIKSARYAVVTPYYKEPRATLERCIASVAQQTVGCDHFLVSDGFAQDWLDEAGVNHLRLGHAHADFGNTPRGLGAMLAIAQHYEGIGFLDADNWLDEDHAELCARAGEERPNIDAVIAKRRFVRYDGSVMDVIDEIGHADTSCFWLKEGSLHLAHFWLMPVELAPLCDRVFYAMIKARNLSLGHVPKPTVNYTCQYEGLYRAVGETPPPDAKKTIDMRPIYQWLCDLSDRKRRLVALQCGIDMVPQAMEALAKADGRTPARPGHAPTTAQPGRNEICPCGSGKKYKHCHGAL